MIRVDREDVARPSVFDKGGDADKELQEARAYYGKKPTKSFPFRVYKSPQIKDALTRLFRGKCAYCESYFSAVQPMDVEHWRPKSIYWWLAASWENLLPSCIDCNRARKHVVLGKKPPAAAPAGARQDIVLLVGKKDRFPIVSEDTRAQNEDDESRENPLLLNPCSEEPAEHLEFLPLTDFERPRPGGRARRRRPAYALGVIRARNPAGKGGLKALESIDVYGLNRSGLVQARSEHRRLIQQKMYTVLMLAELLEEFLADKTRNRLVGLVEDLIGHEMAGLKRLTRADQPFAALARQLIPPFLEGITGERAPPRGAVTPNR